MYNYSPCLHRKYFTIRNELLHVSILCVRITENVSEAKGFCANIIHDVTY